MAKTPISSEPCAGPECVRQAKYGYQGLPLCHAHKEQLRRKDELWVIGSRRPYGTITPQGYRRIFVDGQVRAEHRVVMADHLGRDLLPDESVHHIDGDRLNNCISNLELWTTNHPQGARVRDHLAWAKEILDRYGP